MQQECAHGIFYVVYLHDYDTGQVEVVLPLAIVPVVTIVAGIMHWCGTLASYSCGNIQINTSGQNKQYILKSKMLSVLECIHFVPLQDHQVSCHHSHFCSSYSKWKEVHTYILSHVVYVTTYSCSTITTFWEHSYFILTNFTG